MKTITKISVQQTRGRYNLFLDEAFFCGVSEETLLKIGIKKGMLVDEEELERILKEESKSKCFEYCMRLLGRQNYFERALTNKLRQKEYSEEDIAYALEKLKGYHYIDDKKLAEGFVKDKKKFAKKGPSYIAQSLRMKGVDSDTIKNMLEKHYSEGEELDNCKAAAVKKLESYRKKYDDFYVLKSKLYAYLAQKGFNSSVVCKTIDALLSE